MTAQAPIADMYVYHDEDENCLEISAYKMDDPMYEANHLRIKVLDFKEQRFAINPLYNILFQAGVRLNIQD